MKFGLMPVVDAKGALLAHSVRVGKIVFKKGRKISEADIDVLKAANIPDVQVVQLGSDDVHEDEAAARIAACLSGKQMRTTSPFTGRVNLAAEVGGLILIARDKIDAANRVHEAITIATLAPYAVVEPKTLLATVKIIPFAAPESAVAAVEAILTGAAAVSVAPFLPQSVAYIKSRSINDKSVRITQERLEKLGLRLHGEPIPVAAHTMESFSTAISLAIKTEPDILLIQGDSATVDRADVIPSAILNGGGEIVYFGMPVDPGNLLLLARIGRTKIIVLPGCARSPKENGFDWVLERMAAGQEITPSRIQALGVGGLLKEIGSRPEPRLGANRSRGVRPRFAGVLLAAGMSRRMGSNKLMEAWQGKPLVRYAAEAMAQANLEERIVVAGHEAEKIEAALAGLNLKTIRAPHYNQGMSQSLKSGLHALSDDMDAALVLLGDMPRIKAEHLALLMAAFDVGEGRTICVPTFEGKRGNPVLFGRAYFEELLAVQGDMGGRQIIQSNSDAVVEVPMQDDAIFLDVDTPDALKTLKDRS